MTFDTFTFGQMTLRRRSIISLTPRSFAGSERRTWSVVWSTRRRSSTRSWRPPSRPSSQTTSIRRGRRKLPFQGEAVMFWLLKGL